MFLFNFIYLKCNPSTVSSSINALAAVALEDLIKPYFKLSEKHQFWMSKGLCELITLVAMNTEYEYLHVTELQVQGLLSGSLFGAICISMAGLTSFMGGMRQVQQNVFNT